MLIVNALTESEDNPVNCATCIVTNRTRTTTEAAFKADWKKAHRSAKKSDPEGFDFDSIATIMEREYDWGIMVIPITDVWIQS